MALENVVQGHGDIVLRGEIGLSVEDNIRYLTNIRKVVESAKQHKYPQEVLDGADVEMCGKSHVLIGGLAEELHRRNLRALYRQMYGELPAIPDDFDEYYYEDDEEYDE